MKSWTKKKDHSSPRRGIEPRSLAWQAGILITILPRNYMLRFLCGPSFTKCGFEQNPEVKKIILLLGGELSFGLPRDRRGCSPLYYRGTAFVYRLRTIFHQVSRGISKSNAEPKKVYSSPRRGIEPRSLAWWAGILITILSRNYMLRILCGPSFTKCGFEQNPEVKKIILLLGGELSFGLPRDRRGYSPLYYRGTALAYRLPTIFHQVSRGISKSNAEPKKVYSSPRRGIQTGLSRDGRGYWPLYYRGTTCLEFFVDRLSPNAVLNKILKLKRSFFSSAGNWTPVSPRDRRGYSPLYTEELR